MGLLTTSLSQITANFVDLEKYSGKWYIVAAIPTEVDQHWNYMTETYTLKKNGNISIYTTYVKENKPDSKKTPKEKHIRSKGFPIKGTNNFQWKVQFFWPFKVKYLIEEVLDDYSYTVVGHPDKKYLYFMSREKTMNEELYQTLVKRYKDHGYDMSQMIKIPQ
ncbi:MAG: hypothetical protein JWO32_1793 [Bacteroidetes bacterium]|nr:hypothetical protein [Bacteroidota bacterium]